MKHFIVILTLLTSVVCGVSAQKRGQARIDSLMLDLVTARPDTHKAKILIDLSFTYHSIQPDEGIKYGREGLDLSMQFDFEKGMADAYRALAVNHAFGKSEFAEALSYSNKALALNLAAGQMGDAAKNYNNMGVIHWYLSDFPKALEYYFKALHIHEASGDKVEQANSLANIGLVYNSQKEYPKALEYLKKGNDIDTELGNEYGIASNLGNIAQIYNQMDDYAKALEYNLQAMKIHEKLGDKNGIARNISNIAGIYMRQQEYDKALTELWKALDLHRSIGLKMGIAANIGSIGGSYWGIVKDNKTEMLQKYFGGNRQLALQKALTYVDSAVAMSKEIDDISMLYKEYEIRSEIQSALGDANGALESYKLYTTLKDSVFTLEKDNKLTEAAMQYAFDKKVTAAETEQRQKDAKQRIIRNAISGGLFGSLLFLGIVYRQRNRISREKNIADTEKKRNEELLLNILPEEVADELKTNGKVNAKSYTMVTVMLTDFKDFTTVSEKVSAELLVDEIHHCFSAFDHIIQKYKIEKIKTIGDAYLCASGLPVSNYTHAKDIVAAAEEIREFMAKRKEEKEAKGELPFEIRIGIHTGPLVAGIVGVKKYAYDIWGDTVNLAARMEQNSEAGKINISESTYELIKNDYSCTYRGKIDAKNKGMIDMYFVDHKK